MKHQAGFLSNIKPQEKDPYQLYKRNRNLVRIDVAGGLGSTGIISDVAPLGMGHVISLSPALLYQGEKYQITEDPATLVTNGNPFSIFPLKGTLDQLVETLNAEKEKSTPNKSQPSQA